MKTIKLYLMKKNRLYFDCLNEGGYEVKLKITKESDNLALGEHLLSVNDESVRSKYGTKLIYSLVTEFVITKVVTLKSEYNKVLIEKCRNLGGKWDKENSAWIFPDFVSDEVEELEFKYSTNIVTIDLEVLEDVYGYQEPFCFFGKPLFRAIGRDSGATLSEDVALIKGKISSGGSCKNWLSIASEGSIFRFKISKNLIDEGFNAEKFKVSII